MRTLSQATQSGKKEFATLRQPTITFAARCAASSTTSHHYASAETPEHQDPPPDSWDGQTAWHRAKSPRHATHYPVLETPRARDLTRRPLPARRLARTRPPVRARRSDCAGAKPLSIRRAKAHATE